VLGVTAAAQAVVFVVSGRVALLELALGRGIRGSGRGGGDLRERGGGGSDRAAITAAILRITWQSWLTVRHDVRSSAHHP
jgi:hypothetical protein